MPPSDGSTFDAVFECLADRRRREVVAQLRDREAASLGELAENADGRDERLALELHHRHLPKLADAGLVEYDPDDRAVSSTDRTPAAAVVARTVEQCAALRPDAEPARGDPP